MDRKIISVLLVAVMMFAAFAIVTDSAAQEVQAKTHLAWNTWSPTWGWAPPPSNTWVWTPTGSEWCPTWGWSVPQNTVWCEATGAWVPVATTWSGTWVGWCGSQWCGGPSGWRCTSWCWEPFQVDTRPSLQWGLYGRPWSWR